MGKFAAIKVVCDGNTRDNYTCWLVPIDEVEREEEENTREEDDIAVVVEQEEQEQELQVNDETTPPVSEPEREENASLIGMFVSLIKKLIGKKDGEQ